MVVGRLACSGDAELPPRLGSGWHVFFTVNLLERRRRLLVDHIDDLRRAFAVTRLHRPYEIVAAVVLPDHLHCIWRLPAEDADNATRWRQIKTAFSQSLPRLEWPSAQRLARKERGVWQRRYWERLLRDDRDVQHHVDYIHYNPAKHGLVAHARDWPYLTFHRYSREGMLAADWGIEAPDALAIGSGSVRNEARSRRTRR